MKPFIPCAALSIFFVYIAATYAKSITECTTGCTIQNMGDQQYMSLFYGDPQFIQQFPPTIGRAPKPNKDGSSVFITRSEQEKSKVLYLFPQNVPDYALTVVTFKEGAIVLLEKQDAQDPGQKWFTTKLNTDQYAFYVQSPANEKWYLGSDATSTYYTVHHSTTPKLPPSFVFTLKKAT